MLDRMRVLAAALLAPLLVSCEPAAPQPFDFAEADIGLLPGCPALPGVENVVISGESGVDFRTCKATHVPTGTVLFDIYVGEHSGTPDSGIKYGGATTVNGKTLIWFNPHTGGGWGSPRIWHTYLPTGSPRGTVMVVTLVTHSPGELERISPLIAHLTPSL